MTYSIALLEELKTLPAFSLSPNVKPKTGWNHYPEVQIQGIYSLSNTQQTRSKIRSYLVTFFNALGSCLGIYGLITNSPTAAVIGALPLAFTAIKLGKKSLGFLICPAALCGLYPYFPSFIKNPAYSDFILYRQYVLALINSRESHLTNIMISKNEIFYDTYFITPKEDFKNNPWMIHSMDGLNIPGSVIDDYIHEFALLNKTKMNHIVIAGPSVGNSTGWPSSETIGGGYATAIKILKELNVNSIILFAHGLFGKMTIVKALEAYKFKPLKPQMLIISSSRNDPLGKFYKTYRIGKLILLLSHFCGMNEDMTNMLKLVNIKHIIIGDDKKAVKEEIQAFLDSQVEAPQDDEIPCKVNFMC